MPSSNETLLATLDDFSPTAIEERGEVLRAFFTSAEQRDAARAHLTAQGVSARAIDVSDEDWAVRSQQNLKPITVGRIVVLPDPNLQSPISNLQSIVIRPSMGFGTGHHATTRLCLAALQTLDLEGMNALDVGTGSGILAIAAVRLGAARARGLDFDADAIQSALENLELNPEAGAVTFDVADLSAGPLSPADIVTANLTGAMLVRSAHALMAPLRTGGTLIVSGILAAEEAIVREAFSEAILAERRQEEEWICLVLKKR